MSRGLPRSGQPGTCYCMSCPLHLHRCKSCILFFIFFNRKPLSGYAQIPKLQVANVALDLFRVLLLVLRCEGKSLGTSLRSFCHQLSVIHKLPASQSCSQLLSCELQHEWQGLLLSYVQQCFY